MTLEETIRERIKTAMREKRDVEKSILRLALGELQSEQARSGELSDEKAQKLLRKLIASNEETMSASPDGDHTRLAEEVTILQSLLPKQWGLGETKAFLSTGPALDAVKAAPNDGAATGAAMKVLKAASAPVEGKVVAQAVRELRA